MRKKITLSKRYKKRRELLLKEREVRACKIAAMGKNPLDRLPIIERAYVTARVAGDSIKQASEAVDISTTKARRLEEDPDVQKAYQYLIREIIPANRIVELIKGGTEATINTMDASGKKVIHREPDWRTRRPYIEMAAEHGGFFQRKTDGGVNAPVFNVVVTNVGQTKAPDARVIDASTD